ncbi:lysosome membrane protein 2-like [Pogonomyrmex barbatus]|uniref:Lysosome membrane protein 2-like n=1 Tax=Pogonomyrmex barbatus TaxID=144034 RepID=A0A6I9XDR2_9HYME|nr:lysosome membrane protein 2-like [Pogonomyrmex barbatus]
MTISVVDTTLADIEKRTITNYARRNRLRIWLAWIYGGIFLASFACFYTIWFTDTFDNYLTSQMELRNGSNTFDWWIRPPVKSKYRIYVFNYTNVDEFEAGEASKLRVQEVGPYIYQETLTRVNVALQEDNGTVTFQDKRSYEWIGGRPDNDTVVVPNVPLMSVTAYVRDWNVMLRLSVNMMLASLQERTFVKETAGGFIWGYDTELFHMLKPIIMLQQDISFDKFGILAIKKGIDKDRITMRTGSRGMDSVGMIERVNGVNNRHIWNDERCDKISGTDGSRFPAYLLKDTNQTLSMYLKEICRMVPLHFAEKTITHGIPSLRYKVTPDVYNFSYEQNKCFCPKVDGTRVCPPAGIFNVSACLYGVPFLSSFPHFYGGDKSLLEHVDGLNPRQEVHESYMDIHSRLAAPVGGWSRIQINVEVRKANAVPFLGRLKDGTILPLIWVEAGVDELPAQVLEALKAAHFTAANVEMTLQWGSVIIMILSLSAIIACLWKHCVERNMKIRKKSFISNNILVHAEQPSRIALIKN